MPERALSRILPPTSTPLDRAILDATAGIEQSVGPLTRLYQPRAIDAALLPWLAWSVDVLAWPRNADETPRRNLIAGSWKLHRMQGTLAGYKTMAALCGAEVIKAIAPPAKIYVSASLTRVERNAFIERYPQLRIYPQRLAGQRVGAMLLGLYASAGIHPFTTDATQRLAPQAYLFRDGSESPLQAVERTINSETAHAVSITEVCQPGSAGHVGFCGRSVPFLARSNAAERLYRLSIETPYLDQAESLRRVTISPGLSPLTVRYDWIAGEGQEHGVHASRHVARYLMPSTARERIYKRFWLFDPHINVSRRVASMHCNAGRLGMPAHHAEMLVRISGRTPARSARRFVAGYLCRADQSVLRDTLGALRQVMRISDRISIDTAVISPTVAGEQHLSGTPVAGQWQ